MNSTAVALLLSVVAVGVLSEPPRRRSRDGEPSLPRREFLKTVAASQLPILSDYYWILTTHQIGWARSEAEYRDTFFYADLVTDLDPKFFDAYYFAALAIPYNRGRETWVNTDLSTKLVEKGLKTFPKNEKLRFIRAYNLMFFDKDYVSAGKILKELSEVPGAPAHWADLATRLLAQGGAYEESAAFANLLLQGAADPDSRAFFERRRKEIEAERILRQVDDAAARFAVREGHPPSRLADLVRAGDLTEFPVDPLGGEIVLSPGKRARSTQSKYRLELITPETKND